MLSNKPLLLYFSIVFAALDLQLLDIENQIDIHALDVNYFPQNKKMMAGQDVAMASYCMSCATGFNLSC